MRFGGQAYGCRIAHLRTASQSELRLEAGRGTLELSANVALLVNSSIQMANQSARLLPPTLKMLRDILECSRIPINIQRPRPHSRSISIVRQLLLEEVREIRRGSKT